jgi:hypothetical protein
MNQQHRPSISELLANRPLIEAALGRAVREALLQHARAGRPVAVGKEGKVVWLSPDEILARFAESQAPNAEP